MKYNSKITKFLVSLLLLTFLSLEILAQSGGSTLPYTRIGFNPRIVAIGNAYVAGNGEGIFAHYNPALASFSTHNQVDITGAAMSFDRRFATISSSFPLPPSAGLQFGIVYAGVYDFDGRTPSGYYTDSFNTHDIQLSASFGLRASEKVSIGTSAKFFTARYNDQIDAPVSFSIDLGAIYKLNANTQLGFVIQDLLGELVWDTQKLYSTSGSIQRKDVLPTRIKGGAFHQLLDETLRLYVEFEQRFTKSESYEVTSIIENGRPRIRTKVLSESYTSQFLRFGVSWDLHDRVTMRTGWQSGDTKYVSESQQFSTGFSIKLPFDLYSPTIDYSIVREPQGISWMHMFGIRLHINE
jgi:hypothetical protein